MRLSKKAIEEFRGIYFREFGQELTDEEVQKLGTKLISVFKMICRLIPGDTNTDFSGDIIRY